MNFLIQITMYPDKVTITPVGILVPQTMTRLIDKLNHKFTAYFSSKYITTKRIVLYYQNKTHNIYPKFGIESDAIVVYDDISTKHYASAETKRNSDFALTKYQEIVSASVLEKLHGRYGGTTLVMPCGSGKTLTAIHLIENLGLKATIVVPRAYLKKQWRREFSLYYTALPSITEDYTDQDADILLITAAMFARIAKGNDVVNLINRRTLVIDEVHHFGAEALNISLSAVAYNYCIGLTATPNRIDGLENIYLPFIGPLMEIPYVNGLNYDNTIRVLVKTFRDIPIPIFYRKGDNKSVNYSRIIEEMVANKSYNQRLLDAISLIHNTEPSRRILVLSDRVEHVTRLYNMTKITNTALFTGNDRRGVIDENSDYNIIFATYGVATEGFNVKSLNTLVFATPRRNSTEQLIGRILRKKHDCSALVLDAIPNNRILHYQRVNGRIPGYKKMNAEIMEDDYMWENM